MSKKTPSTKPPTQVAGVQGFVAFEAVPTQPPSPIDWQHLIGLPPFQMYAVERAGKSPSEVMDWMPEWMSSQDPITLYSDYCQWHAAKDYWPDETPLGEVMSG